MFDIDRRVPGLADGESRRPSASEDETEPLLDLASLAEPVRHRLPNYRAFAARQGATPDILCA